MSEYYTTPADIIAGVRARSAKINEVIQSIEDGFDALPPDLVDAVSLTDANVVLTNADVVSTNADVVSTNADVVSTNADVVSTNADVVITNADVVTTTGLIDNFDDRYLGAQASDPALDNDGDALVDGALYFNTTIDVMKVYDLGTTTWLLMAPTSGEQTNINTVASISTDVTTAATNVADITNFADVYQGGKAADPATRNDSSALQEGDLYFNTTTDAMMIYTGVAWEIMVTLPVGDTTAVVKGSVDATKLVRIEADGLTAGTTRVLIMPDKDLTPAASGVNPDITSMTGLDDNGIPLAKVANAASDGANSDITSMTGLDDNGIPHAAISNFGTLFPTHFERATRPARSAADTITVYAGTVINVNEKIFTVASDTPLELNTNGSWDTGTALNDAARAGNDYYVYACDNSGTLALLVSANSTTPTGYTTDTSRKIGGFHCLCVAVGTIAGHTLTDFTQGDILPTTVWDLKHRAKNGIQTGKYFSQRIQKWVYIYLQSGTGVNSTSVNGGTITDTRAYWDHAADAAAVGERLLWDYEFTQVALGVQEGVSILGAADPVTTGGHLDATSRRSISNDGAEDTCGVVFQWCADVYGSSNALLAGGNWYYGASSGSRSRVSTYARTIATYIIGGRFASEPL